MVDQAQIEGGERSSVPSPHSAGNIADLLHDVLTLAELQWRLFVVDLRRAGWLVGLKFAALTFGIVLAVSCIPLALVTVALSLVEFAGWGYTRAFGATLLLALVVAVAIIGVSIWRFGTMSDLFQRSLAEGIKNIRWLEEKLGRLRHPMAAASAIWGRPRTRPPGAKGPQDKSP